MKGFLDMKIMALNLHSYQEDRQIEKFDIIAKKIVEYDMDIACFCECSQKLTSTQNPTIQPDNALQIICDKVNEYSNHKYECRWEFAHYGFAVYEEGIGVITKLPIKNVESRYVSKTVSAFDFRSRKIMKITTDHLGKEVDIYIIHMNTTTDPYDPFREQFKNLLNWIEEKEGRISILAGDFAIEPYSNNYDTLIDEDFIDHYLQAVPEGREDYTFINPPGLEFSYERKLRLDYIFSNENYNCTVAKRFFLEDEKVSDHAAVYCELSK